MDRTYKFLKEEGKEDTDFFAAQMTHFKAKLALRAFTDIPQSQTIQEIIDHLKTLIQVCKLHQSHLERMEQSEYKAYIAQLLVNIRNAEGQEEQARTSDTEPPIPKRKITWAAEG